MSKSPRVSVDDFESEEDLLQELVMDEIERKQPAFSPQQQQRTATTSHAAAAAAGETNQQQLRDIQEAEPDQEEIGTWMLYEYDEQTTEATTAHEEFRRLQVLKSYAALDIQDQSIDRLTRTASLTFGVVGAWVCLVDFRRIVYFSKHGLDGLGILPRADRYACAHAIQYRADRVYVVPDMSKNRLYDQVDFVVEEPHFKFYASAPLISPEGFRIGTFGLIDPTARPAGLDEDEKDALVDYAAVAVKILADHRFEVRIREKMARAIAVTSHHMVTPLNGLQLSLSLLKEDGQETESNFSPEQREMIAAAETCSSAMARMTREAFADLRSEMLTTKAGEHDISDTGSRSSSAAVQNGLPDCSIGTLIDRINEVRWWMLARASILLSVRVH